MRTRPLPGLGSNPRTGRPPGAATPLGPLLPGRLVAAEWNAYKIRTGRDHPAIVDGMACVAGNDPGAWIAFPARAARAFMGDLVVEGASPEGATVLDIRVNGARVGQVTLAQGLHLADSSALRGVAIPAGLVVIRLEVLSGGLTLGSIAIE